MPASLLTRSSKEVSAACTLTSKPLASRCLTQLPQHSQVVDFQTSTVGLAAKAGEPNRRAKAKASNRIFIKRLLPVGSQLTTKALPRLNASGRVQTEASNAETKTKSVPRTRTETQSQPAGSNWNREVWIEVGARRNSLELDL